jgi:hypothetical protein
MSLKTKWSKKNVFLEETFEMDGEQVTIREMSGLEKAAMDDIEDLVDKSYFIWKLCVINESLHLSEDEFKHAFNYSHAEVDGIIARIIKMSSPEKLKN